MSWQSCRGRTCAARKFPEAQRFRVDDGHRPLRRRGGFHIRPIVRAFAGKPQARQAGLLQGTPILQYAQPGQQRLDAN